MIDVIEILTHWYAGRSQNELATSLGVDRKTLRKYTAPAVAAGITPGGPPMDEQDWRRLAAGWFPQLTDYRLRQVSWPSIEGAGTTPEPTPARAHSVGRLAQCSMRSRIESTMAAS